MAAPTVDHAPSLTPISAGDLRRKIRKHLNQSGALRSMKGELRARVLRTVAASDIHLGEEACADSVRRHADAVVEHYLRTTGRAYSHSVFCAEAGVVEGTPSSDASRGWSQANVLEHLVRTIRADGEPHGVSAATQTHAVIGSLHDKLRSVDEEFRVTKANENAARVQDMRAEFEVYRTAVKTECEQAAFERLQHWKQQELAKSKTLIEAEYHAKLEGKVRELAATEASLRAQVASERFCAEQAKREADLRAASVETEKAEMRRLLHTREHSLEAASEQIAALRREVQLSNLRAREVEAEKSRQCSATERLETNLARAESELAVERAERARLQRSLEEHVARLDTETGRISQDSYRSFRGSELALHEVNTIHHQLHRALERLAQVELAQQGVPTHRSKPAAPQTQEESTATASTTKANTIQQSVNVGGSERTHGSQEEAAAVDVGAGSPQHTDADRSEVQHASRGNQRYKNESESDESSARSTPRSPSPLPSKSPSPTPHRSPIATPQPQVVCEDDEPEHPRADELAAELQRNGEHLLRLYEEGLDTTMTTWLNEHAAFKAEMQQSHLAVQEAEKLRLANEAAEAERQAALLREQREEEWRKRREAAQQEEPDDAAAPTTYQPLAPSTDDDDVSSVDILGGSDESF